MIDSARVAELEKAIISGVSLRQDEVNDLLAALDELERLRERLKNTETWWRNAQNYAEKMRHSRDSLRGPLTQMKARAEKSEAKLLTAQAVNAKNGAVIVEQMAELERVRPLVEAAMEWDGSSENEDGVLGAALAYKESK